MRNDLFAVTKLMWMTNSQMKNLGSFVGHIRCWVIPKKEKKVMNLLSFQAVINLISPVLPKVSWFPPKNIWDLCGYSVGQWTEECEKWFQEHVGKIHSGTFQPLSPSAWRTLLGNTRLAGKVAYQMRKGAADFISANKHFLESPSTI